MLGLLGLGVYEVLKKRVQHMLRFSLRVRDRESLLLDLMFSDPDNIRHMRCY